jgi:hypothetical protein
MKKLAKAALFRSLSLGTRARLVHAFLNNVTNSASGDDADLLDWLFAAVDQQQVLLEDRIRQIRFSGRLVADGAASEGQPPLQTYLMEDQSPWMQGTGKFDPIAMPGMISEEEARYYEYIGGRYRGHGEAIELGPWLGKSTRHIIRGLDKNPKFFGKQLYVFDDFVWRSSWMNLHIGDREQLVAGRSGGGHAAERGTGGVDLARCAVRNVGRQSIRERGIADGERLGRQAVAQG